MLSVSNENMTGRLKCIVVVKESSLNVPNFEKSGEQIAIGLFVARPYVLLPVRPFKNNLKPRF